MEHKWPKQKSAAKIPPAAPHHRPPNNLLEREAARPGLDDGGADVRPAPGRSPSPSPGDSAQPRRGRGVDDDAGDAPAPLSPGAGEAPEIAPPVPRPVRPTARTASA